MEERTVPTELPGTQEEPQPWVAALCPQGGPCALHQDGHSPKCRALPRGGRQPLQQGGSQTSGSHPMQGSCPQNDYRGRTAPAVYLGSFPGEGFGWRVRGRCRRCPAAVTWVTQKQISPAQGSCCMGSSPNWAAQVRF